MNKFRRTAVVSAFMVIAITAWPGVSRAQNVPQEVIDQFREFAAQKAVQAGIRANMRTLQIAVESYATDSGGVYPESVLEYKPYFEGGENKIGGKGGPFPTNPITGATDETPYDAEVSSVEQIEKMRKMPPQITPGKPGGIGFSVFNKGQTYAIIGTDVNGNALPDKNGKTLVFSNHDFENQNK